MRAGTSASASIVAATLIAVSCGDENTGSPVSPSAAMNAPTGETDQSTTSQTRVSASAAESREEDAAEIGAAAADPGTGAPANGSFPGPRGFGYDPGAPNAPDRVWIRGAPETDGTIDGETAYRVLADWKPHPEDGVAGIARWNLHLCPPGGGPADIENCTLAGEGSALAAVVQNPQGGTLEGRAVKGTYSGYLRFSNLHGWGIPAGGGTAIKVGIPTGRPDQPKMIGADDYGYDVFVSLGGREFATVLQGLRWEAMNDVFIKEWRIRAWPKGGRQTTTITKRRKQGPGQELTGVMINLPAGEWTITVGELEDPPNIEVPPTARCCGAAGIVRRTACACAHRRQGASLRSAPASRGFRP